MRREEDPERSRWPGSRCCVEEEDVCCKFEGDRRPATLSDPPDQRRKVKLHVATKMKPGVVQNEEQRSTRKGWDKERLGVADEKKLEHHEFAEGSAEKLLAVGQSLS